MILESDSSFFFLQFLQHDLIIEAARPGLFVDKNGSYWDVPSSVSVDLASNVSDSGLSYHLCVQHNSGSPKNLKAGEDTEVPSSLLSDLCAKSAFCFTKNVDIWRKKDGKVKMVQPYDMFLSDPHVSVAGNIGKHCIFCRCIFHILNYIDDDFRFVKHISLSIININYIILPKCLCLQVLFLVLFWAIA